MTAPGIFGQVYNVTCGLQTTVNNLFSSLQEISARKIPAQYEKRRSGEVRRTLASIDLVRSHLGYEVKVELQEGLWAARKWFQEKKG
jgi:UDP-glucose 4-epimerase